MTRPSSVDRCRRSTSPQSALPSSSAVYTSMPRSRTPTAMAFGMCWSKYSETLTSAPCSSTSRAAARFPVGLQCDQPPRAAGRSPRRRPLDGRGYTPTQRRSVRTSDADAAVESPRHPNDGQSCRSRSRQLLSACPREMARLPRTVRCAGRKPSPWTYSSRIECGNPRWQQILSQQRCRSSIPQRHAQQRPLQRSTNHLARCDSNTRPRDYEDF